MKIDDWCAELETLMANRGVSILSRKAVVPNIWGRGYVYKASLGDMGFGLRVQEHEVLGRISPERFLSNVIT